MSLKINGEPVDFTDATKYYNVSTVNYLAAGSCNFNDGGVSLWPLDQIVNDTQYYVRDAVIDYITAKGTVSPAIEGRLAVRRRRTARSITITSPEAKTYLHSATLPLTFAATDAASGVRTRRPPSSTEAVDDGAASTCKTLALGSHTFTVTAIDCARQRVKHVP